MSATHPAARIPGLLILTLVTLAAGGALGQTHVPAGDANAWLPVPIPLRYAVDADGVRRLETAPPAGDQALELKVLRFEADVYPTLVTVKGELELTIAGEAPPAYGLGLVVPDYRAGAPLQEVSVRVNDQPVTVERRLVAAQGEDGPVVHAWRPIALPQGVTGDVRVAFRYAVVLTGTPWEVCGHHGQGAVHCRRHELHLGTRGLGAFRAPLGPRDLTLRLHGVDRRWVLADATLDRDALSAARAAGLAATDVNETTLRWSLPAGAAEEAPLTMRMAIPALSAAGMLDGQPPYEVKALSPALQLWDQLVRFGAGRAPAAADQEDPLPWLRPTRAQWRGLVETLKDRAVGGAPDVKALASAMLADLYHAAAWQAAGAAPEGALGELPALEGLPPKAKRTLRWLGGPLALERAPGSPWAAWDGGAAKAKAPPAPEGAPWHAGTPLQRFGRDSALYHPLPALEVAAETSHQKLLVFFAVPLGLLLILLIVLIVRARRARRRAG